MAKTAKYFHTLDGKPAAYVPGEQICFLMPGRFALSEFLVDDLATIRQQQAASEAWRIQEGHDPSSAKHGYQRLLAEPLKWHKKLAKKAGDPR